MSDTVGFLVGFNDIDWLDFPEKGLHFRNGSADDPGIVQQQFVCRYGEGLGGFLPSRIDNCNEIQDQMPEGGIGLLGSEAVAFDRKKIAAVMYRRALELPDYFGLPDTRLSVDA